MSNLNNAGHFSVLSSVTVVPFSAPSAKYGTSSIDLMKHSQAHWQSIFHFPYSAAIASLFQTNPLVRTTMLALSACHLRHVAPAVRQHRVAEHFQQSLALHDYTAAVAVSPGMLGQANVDAVMLSAVLLNALLFALPESESAAAATAATASSSITEQPEPSASAIYGRHNDRLGWLALQAGVRPLLRSMAAAHLDKTLRFLAAVVLGSTSERWVYSSYRVNQGDVPETWAKVFGLDNWHADSLSGEQHPTDCEAVTPLCDSTWSTSAFALTTTHMTTATIAMTPSRNSSTNDNNNNVFRLPALVLLQLRVLEPVSSNIFKNSQFLGKVQGPFRDRLHEGDPRALWLVGYWLGLLCRYEGVWWCEGRARRDYKAVCARLEGMKLAEGAEGEVWKEMMGELRGVAVYKSA